MEGFNLGEEAYKSVLKLLKNQYATETAGTKQDMGFLYQDYWLKDTAVISNVIAKNGMWQINLVFAYYNKPHQLIKRIIGQYPSHKRALIGAHYMQRIAAKDQRGTFKVDSLQFSLTPN